MKKKKTQKVSIDQITRKLKDNEQSASDGKKDDEQLMNVPMMAALSFLILVSAILVFPSARSKIESVVNPDGVSGYESADETNSSGGSGADSGNTDESHQLGANNFSLPSDV